MKFSVAVNRFQEIINKGDRVTTKKAALPILTGIFIEAKNNQVIIRSTNLEIGFEARVPAQVDEEGQVVVESGILRSFLSSARSGQNAEFQLKDKTLEVKSGSNQATITSLNASDYPSLPSLAQGESVTSINLPTEKFIEGVSSVWYASSNSTMKPELSSIYIYTYNNELYFVATDSFRLAEKAINGNLEGEIESLLIPYNNAVEITKLLDEGGVVEINFDSNLLVIKQANVTITSRVVDGNFPDYRQIIPSEFSLEVSVLKYDFENALKLSSVFADKFHQVTLSFDNDGVITVESKGTEVGKSVSKINATITGEPLSMRFNQRYLIEPLNAIKGENLKLYLDDGKPMIIKTPSDSTFRYLVMSMHQ